MVQQVTEGIKISVQSHFDGTFYQNNHLHFAFSYQVTIENQSDNVVQLATRHWQIMDSLCDTTYVDGEGVIGKKPILQPGQSHTYQSGCLLRSPIGNMKGHYQMLVSNTSRQIKVLIPSFQLSASFILN
jgi:ApaG protein